MNNNTTATNVSYAGIVDFSYLADGKRISLTKHNTGLPALFKYLVRALVGDASVVSDRPTLLDIRYANNASIDIESEEWKSCLKGKIPFSAPTYEYDKDKGSWKATYTAVISVTSLVDMKTLSGKDFKLFMCSEKTDFACLDVKYDDLVKITPGTQGLVDWNIFLSNE